MRFFLLGAGLSKDQAVRVWEQLDENKNGKVSYPEFSRALRRNQLQRATRHRRDGLDGVGLHWFIFSGWNFSSDMCRAAVGGSLADFLKYARNPTFAQLVDHESWSGKLGNRIPATQTRGALTTNMVTVQTNRGQERKFLMDAAATTTAAGPGLLARARVSLRGERDRANLVVV